MSWSKRAKQGAIWTGFGTVAVIAVSVIYLWIKTAGLEGVSVMEFVKIALVMGLVFAAIGAVMMFFIVMVLRKNEALDSKK